VVTEGREGRYHQRRGEHRFVAAGQHRRDPRLGGRGEPQLAPRKDPPVTPPPSIFIVSRNLWVAAAHHSCWNATIFLIGVPLSGENWRALAPLETVSHGSVLWTGGAFGPEDSLVNVVVSILICAALWRLSQHRGSVRVVED
jgi:hypothetical protein